jgi:Ca2+-binding RTX toxin-like protein
VAVGSNFKATRYQASGPDTSGIVYNPYTANITVTGTSGNDLIRVRNNFGLRIRSNNFYRGIYDTEVQLKTITVNGNAGNDVIDCGGLSATDGHAVAVTLNGGDGNDILSGGAGNDLLIGGAGADKLYGNDGDDRLDGGTSGDDMWGGSGVDTVDYSMRTAAVTVTLADNLANDGEAGIYEKDNAHSDIENVVGGSGSDTITGNASDNVLIGNAGNDTLRGGNGADTLNGGSGADKLYGENGNDFLLARDSATGPADTVDGGAGNDQTDADLIDTFVSAIPIVRTTGGYSTFATASDSRVIYLDPTPGGPGKDTNSGLSSAAPVFSWNKAVSLMRNGYPDWLLIKRGTTLNVGVTNWNKSGRSGAYPMVISTYGDPNAARPKFLSGNALYGFSTETR